MTVEDKVPQATPIKGRSVLGLRVSLYAMAALTACCGYPATMVLPGLKYFGEYNPVPMAELHRATLLTALAFATALPMYLLAAIHVGLTRRGRFYLVLAAVAFAAQMMLGLAGQGLTGCFAVLPVAIAGIFANVQVSHDETRERLRHPSTNKLVLWPDLVLIPAGLALVAALVTQINSGFIPDEPNPPREFDTTEGWSRLDSAVADSLPALEQVDGFTGLGAPEEEVRTTECYGGAAWDETWVDDRRTYELAEEASVSESPWADYLTNLRERWASLGWEISHEESRSSAAADAEFFTLAAVRDDGVTVTYRVDNGGAELQVATGCILEQ